MLETLAVQNYRTRLSFTLEKNLGETRVTSSCDVDWPKWQWVAR